MNEHNLDLSDEIYRRLYRLIKRGVEPRRIAATLELPIKTVQNIIFRLEQGWNGSDSGSHEDHDDYLDAYLLTKTRHTVLQLVGKAVSSTLNSLQTEIAKLENCNSRAMAIKISDVTQIDEPASKELIEFKKRMDQAGRYVALLDPPQELEPALLELKLEESIPVFGTETAFEERAFARKSEWKGKP